jgi:hypothetical protein
MFLGIGGEPTAEENRLYECVKALPTIESDLKARLPLPEINDVMDSARRNTETWCFDLLLKDKLQEKGWPTYPQAGQDGLLCGVLEILSAQADDRVSFDMVLTDYKKRKGAEAGAVKFLREHVGDLEEVVASLKVFTPTELTTKHKCMLVVKNKPQPGPVQKP